MSTAALSFALDALLVAGPLALLAYAVQRRGARPHLAHLLWTLVLLKLVLPPVITAPIVGWSVDAGAPPAADAQLLLTLPDAAAGELDATRATDTSRDSDALRALAAAWTRVAPRGLAQQLAWLWALGSAAVLAVSLTRVTRFARLLRASSGPASAELQARVARLASRLGLRRAPELLLTSARLSPMLWSAGGRAQLVLPRALVDALPAAELDHVLAHELAHLRRGDHRMRWLEWLACVVAWWNPITWCARRGLRAQEEICCDALVLHSTRARPHDYATALLGVVEWLAEPVHRPPVCASGINSGGSLQRRFQMIISQRVTARSPLAARILVGALALAALPVGVAYAQDDEPAVVKVRTRLVETPTLSPEVQDLADRVARGEIELGTARALFEALPPSEGTAKRYAAAAAKLDKAVAEELLTAEEAEGKKAVLAAHLRERAFHMEVLGMSSDEARVAMAVKTGSLTPAEGATKVLLESKLRKPADWAPGFLKEIGVPRDAAPRVAEAMHAVTAAELKLGPEAAADARRALSVTLEEAGLTPEQVEKVNVAVTRVPIKARTVRRVSGAKAEGVLTKLQHLGVGDASLGKVKLRLAELEVPRAVIEPALGGVLRLVLEMRDEGDAYAMDPALRGQLTALELSDAQIAGLEKLAAEVAADTSAPTDVLTLKRVPETDADETSGR